MALDAKKI